MVRVRGYNAGNQFNILRQRCRSSLRTGLIPKPKERVMTSTSSLPTAVPKLPPLPPIAEGSDFLTRAKNFGYHWACEQTDMEGSCKKVGEVAESGLKGVKTFIQPVQDVASAAYTGTSFLFRGVKLAWNGIGVFGPGAQAAVIIGGVFFYFFFLRRPSVNINQPISVSPQPVNVYLPVTGSSPVTYKQIDQTLLSDPLSARVTHSSVFEHTQDLRPEEQKYHEELRRAALVVKGRHDSRFEEVFDSDIGEVVRRIDRDYIRKKYPGLMKNWIRESKKVQLT